MRELANSNALSGKVIISTRPVDAAFCFAQMLEEYGATVYHLPMIEIRKCTVAPEASKRIKAVDSYNWLVFKSMNAVSFFFDLLNEEELAKIKNNVKVAAIGSKTVEVLRKYGITDVYSNPGETSRELFTFLKDKLKSTDKVLIPMGDLSNKSHDAILSGFAVECITVYNNCKPVKNDIALLDKITNNNYDLLTFASPSSIINLKKTLNNDKIFSNLKTVCIGATTANAMRELGGQVLVTAQKANNQGLVEAILEHFKTN